jgi:hypothetical protein
MDRSGSRRLTLIDRLRQRQASTITPVFEQQHVPKTGQHPPGRPIPRRFARDNARSDLLMPRQLSCSIRYTVRRESPAMLPRASRGQLSSEPRRASRPSANLSGGTQIRRRIPQNPNWDRFRGWHFAFFRVMPKRDKAITLGVVACNASNWDVVRRDL